VALDTGELVTGTAVYSVVGVDEAALIGCDIDEYTVI
jgi:hypothetical protein